MTALIFVLFVVQLPVAMGSAVAQNRTVGRAYPETSQVLAPEFVDYFDTHGGLALFGYPISPARIENGRLVQWTERQRLEHHPEHRGSEHEVLLGLLGRELTRGFEGPDFTSSALRSRALAVQVSLNLPAHTFAETGHTVTEPFLGYWRDRGGLAVFGYPISALHEDERGIHVQWFERARFEFHPDLPTEHQVLLGHLGLETLKHVGRQEYRLQVHSTPAPDGVLKIGLAQGGESDDPAFFDNIRREGRDLGSGLVRLDNIYNYYDIVHRAPDGSITYRWDKLDRIVDGVFAMGQEPLLCLSYMPETMSVSGSSRILPPVNYAEWAMLVKATVTHLNVERKLGIRYWEVWNEPDQWSFWQGSFVDYLRLYDTTVEAALSADPTVKIGGPAIGRFSPEHLEEFLAHESAQGSRGRVDFLSWHSYGPTPQQLAAQIREARRLADRFPQFAPELFITEFNVLQGGPGDTSAGGKTDTVGGAIAFLAYIESMQRERLDHAFLFELKDGPGPKSFWGRWGILTHDARPKPIYHAVMSFRQRPAGMLPVSIRSGPSSSEVGMMAFGGPGRSQMMLWYTGEEPARIKIDLPENFAGGDFDATLFDKDTNNPARTGATRLVSTIRNAGDLVFSMQPESLVLISSK